MMELESEWITENPFLNLSSSSHGENNSKRGHIIEIGTQAVWSVSSCKPGYGIAHLRDNSTDTYWQ